MSNPNTTHTPGPWLWRWESSSLHQVCTKHRYGPVVLSPSYDYEDGQEIQVSDRDAALIASAPDLLVALEGILRVADCATVEFAVASAAIAKARGNQQ